MNRLLGSFLLVWLFGCASTDEAPQPQGDVANLVVVVNGQGTLWVGNYIVDAADFPEMVKQWHVKSAVVRGDTGSKFSDALKVQTELQAAGVDKVSINESGAE